VIRDDRKMLDINTLTSTQTVYTADSSGIIVWSVTPNPTIWSVTPNPTTGTIAVPSIVRVSDVITGDKLVIFDGRVEAGKSYRMNIASVPAFITAEAMPDGGIDLIVSVMGARHAVRKIIPEIELEYGAVTGNCLTHTLTDMIDEIVVYVKLEDM
jgi:PKD repeat protein